MLLWCDYLNNLIFHCHLLQTAQLKTTLEGKQKDFSNPVFGWKTKAKTSLWNYLGNRNVYRFPSPFCETRNKLITSGGEIVKSELIWQNVLKFSNESLLGKTSNNVRFVVRILVRIMLWSLGYKGEKTNIYWTSTMCQILMGFMYLSHLIFTVTQRSVYLWNISPNFLLHLH